MARAQQPFAIALDFVIPTQEGLETLAALKADPQTRNIPVVMVSIMNDGNKGLTLGMVDHLQKPIEAEQLLEKLHAIASPDDNILIVEDRDADANLLETILKSAGYSTRRAADGMRAIEMVQTKKPGLILLDLMLPEMSGFEVIHELHNQEETRNIPIIVISAKSLDKVEVQYLDQHVQKIITKGTIEPASFLDRIGNTLADISAQTHRH